MARKRSLPAALMALPQALKDAVLRTIPEETIDQLDPSRAVAIGLELERTSRAIASLLTNDAPPAGGDDGR